MKKKISIVLTITVPFCLAAVLFLFYRFDPSDVPLFPKCIFHLLTGLECPGCGIQRALHHLLHGEFTEALRYNAVAVLVIIPYLSLFFLLRIIILVREWRGKQEREPREKCRKGFSDASIMAEFPI